MLIRRSSNNNNNGEQVEQVHRNEEDDEHELELAMLNSGSPVEEQLTHLRPALRCRPLAHASSVQSLSANEEQLSEATDSPHSLDHYYGFGANYHRHQHSSQPTTATFRRQQADRAQSNLSFPPVVQPVQVESSMLLAYREPQLPVLAPPLQQHMECNLLSGYYNSRISQAGAAYVQSAAPNQQPLMVAGLDRRHLGESSSMAHQQPASVDYSQQPLAVTTPTRQPLNEQQIVEESEVDTETAAGNNTDQQSSTTEADKWSDSDADAIIRGAKETAQMAMSMYQFTKGEGDLNTTQDLFTQAELFAEEANELYKEVRCFSYKVSIVQVRSVDWQMVEMC